MVQTESPRGRILDRNGVVLVENAAEWVGHRRPRARRRRPGAACIGQLAEVLAPQYTAEQLEENFNDLRQTPLKPAIVAVGVPENGARRDPRAHRGLPGHEGAEADGAALPARASSPRTSSATSARSPTSSSRRVATTATKKARRSARTAPSARSRTTSAATPRRETVEVDPTGNRSAHRSSVEPGTIGNDVHAHDRRELAGRGRARARAGHRVGARAAEREHQGQALRDVEGAGRRGRRDGRHRRFGRRDGVVPDLRRRASSSTASARPSGRRSTTTPTTRS